MTLRRSILVALALAVILSSLLPARRACAAELGLLLDKLDEATPIERFRLIEQIGGLGTPESIRALVSLMGAEETAWLSVRQLIIQKDAAVPSLIEALDSPNRDTVKYAAYILGALKHREAIPRIARLFARNDPEMRQFAVFALGEIGDQAAFETLTAGLRDPENVVREYAAAALERLGEQRAIPALKQAIRIEQGAMFNMATALYTLGDREVVDILINRLRQPESVGRLYAVYALGKLRDRSTVEPLVECLTDPTVRWLAVRALASLQDAAVTPLLAAAASRDPGVRLGASEALGDIGDRRAIPILLERIIDTDLGVRGVAAAALVRIRDRSTSARLIELLRKGDPSIKAQVLRVLAALGDPATVADIIAAASSPDAAVRINAVFALGELRDTRGIGTMIARLGDERMDVSQTAVAALVKMGAPAISSLLEIVATPKHASLAGCVQVLGRLKAREAVRPLIDLLNDANPLVRRNATVALTEIGDPGAEERFVMLLSDADPVVRLYAGIGLMQFGGRLSVKLLINALKAEETRWLAVRILDRIGAKGTDELIAALRDPTVQWDVSQTLISLDGAVLPDLQRALRDENQTIRENIAMILGEVKDRRAVDALLEALQSNDRLVAMAAPSLVSIGDQNAVEPLIQCLHHQNDLVRVYAAWALGSLGNPAAVDQLIGCLSDRDPKLRGTAAHSLGQLKARVAVPRLAALLTDTDDGVRISAVWALGNIGDSTAIPFVRELLQRDDSARVRTAATTAWEKLLTSTGR